MSTFSWFDRRRLRRIAVGLVSTVAAYAALVGLVAPPIVRSVAQKKLTQALHRQTTIKKIVINPFALSVAVRGLEIRDRDGGPFVGFEELFVDLQLMSAWKRGAIVREVTLTRPAITVVRETQQRYNFSDLIVDGPSEPPPPPDAPPAAPARYSINNIRIVGASIDFVDHPLQAMHTVRDLSIAVPFVSNLPYDIETYVQPAFAASIDGTTLTLGGRSKPFSGDRQTQIDIDLRDLSLARYVEYVPVKLGFALPSALLDAALTVEFAQREGAAPSLALAGKVALKKVELRDGAGQPLAALDRLAVEVARSEPLLGRLALAKVEIEKPTLWVRRARNGRLNLEDLAPAPAPPATTDEKPQAADEKAAEARAKAAEKAKAARPDAAPFVVAVEKLALSGGTVHVSDAAAPGGPFTTTIEELTVGVRHFSTAPGVGAAIELGFRSDGGERFADRGELVLSPLAAKGHLALEGVPLKRYAPYYKPAVLLDVDKGTLDVAGDYDFHGAALALHAAELTLHGLSAHRRGEARELFGVNALAVKQIELDLGQQRLQIGDVATSGGRVQITRAANGALNLASLTPPTPTTTTPGPAAQAPVRPARPEASAPGWAVALQHVGLQQWTVRFDDQAVESPVSIVTTLQSLSLADLSTERGKKARLALRARINKGGTLAATGTLVPQPLAAALRLDAKALDVVPLQPYFENQVNLLVTSGEVSFGGNLTLATTPKGPVTHYRGTFGVDKLTTLDGEGEATLVKWDSLFVNGIDAGNDPLAVNLREVSLSTFYARLAVSSDGRLNIKGLVAEPSGAAGAAPASASAGVTPAGAAPASASAGVTPAGAAPAGASTGVTPASAGASASAGGTSTPSAATSASAAPPPIRIAKVTLQGGTIDYSDDFVRPSFAASLSEVGGRINGLSSANDTTADLDLRAKLSGVAPLEITGKINPLARELALDVAIVFRDIELSALSPYSGKYVGYKIAKGKLTLELKYDVQKRKLAASNKLFVDQLTLGEPVQSKSATRLPVKLALAVLRDARGEIHLDLPISGSLDDPKFRVGKLVAQVLLNVVVKAATEPFALLGSLFGRGPELSYLEFGPGRADVDAAMSDKLRVMQKVLQSRPGLKLEVAGHIGPDADREGLRKLFFERKLKAQKVKVLAKEGTATAEAVDDVKIAPEEYEKYLRLAYKDEKFPKPRNAIGLVKELPAGEVEKLMLTHITVDGDDLRQLAHRRAEAARQQLVTAGIAGERIFVIEPADLVAQRKDKARETRVDFSLR